MKLKNIHDNKPARKRPGVKRVVFQITLVLITFLLVAFLLAYCFVISKLNKLNRTSNLPGAESDNTTSVVVQTEDDIIASAEEEAENREMQKAIGELEEMEAVAATGDVFADSNVFNILLIGTDERTVEFNTNARGDACLLLSLNKSNSSVHLISFERGMGVPILGGEYEGQYDWLTHTFRYGGADLMMEEIRECFKVDVTHYVRVNLNTFIDGINAVGGVDVELTQEEADYINQSKITTYNIYINKSKSSLQDICEVAAGLNHLNGETALTYARCRKIDSDWSRIGRQRAVIQAALNQVKEMSVFELNDLTDTLLPLVQTNLTNGEIISLILASPKFIGQTMIQDTIPISGSYGGMTGMGGRSLYAVDFEANAQYLHELLYDEGE